MGCYLLVLPMKPKKKLLKNNEWKNCECENVMKTLKTNLEKFETNFIRVEASLKDSCSKRSNEEASKMEAIMSRDALQVDLDASKIYIVR